MSARDQAALKSVPAAPATVAEEARAILSRLGVPDSAFAPAGRPGAWPEDLGPGPAIGVAYNTN